MTIATVVFSTQFAVNPFLAPDNSKTPYELASAFIGISDLEEMGSCKTLTNLDLIEKIKAVGSFLLQSQGGDEKNGRIVRTYPINQGEMVLYSSKEKPAILGNHCSGNHRTSLLVVIQATAPVLARWCTAENPQLVREKRLQENDVAIFHEGEIHSIGLPCESHVLLFTNKSWAPGLPLPENRGPLIVKEDLE